MTPAPPDPPPPEDRGPLPGDCTAGFAPVYARIFRADPVRTRRILDEVRQRLGPRIDGDAAARTELVLAEILNNIALHGRPLPPGGYPQAQAAVIHLRIALDGVAPLCMLSDTGRPIPAHCIHDPQAPAPALLPENGFGWSLIRALTGRLHYMRDGQRNLLCFSIPA